MALPNRFKSETVSNKSTALSAVEADLKYRCLKKKWDLFFDQYLDQIKHKSAGYIFHLKG